MTYTELPYEFDLLYDVKSVQELHSILKGEPHRTSATIQELCELMDKYNMPIPFGRGLRLKQKGKFPSVVWIDNNGGYRIFPPCTEERHNFQRMRVECLI